MIGFNQIGQGQSQYKDRILVVAISIVKKKCPWDCLIFIMGIPIGVRRCVYIEIVASARVMATNNVMYNKLEFETSLYLNGQSVLLCLVSMNNMVHLLYSMR